MESRFFHTKKQESRGHKERPLGQAVSAFLTLEIVSKREVRALCAFDLRAEVRGEKARKSHCQNEKEKPSPPQIKAKRP